MKLTTYHRTDHRGNITAHASNTLVTDPQTGTLCGAGAGVDGYVKEWDVNSWQDVQLHVHCKRCLSVLARERIHFGEATAEVSLNAPVFAPFAPITAQHVEQARASILDDPSLGFGDSPALAIDKFITRLLSIANAPPGHAYLVQRAAAHAQSAQEREAEAFKQAGRDLGIEVVQWRGPTRIRVGDMCLRHGSKTAVRVVAIAGERAAIVSAGKTPGLEGWENLENLIPIKPKDLEQQRAAREAEAMRQLDGPPPARNCPICRRIYCDHTPAERGAVDPTDRFYLENKKEQR